MGSIPGRRTKVPHAVWSGQKTEGQYEHSTMEAKPLWDIKTFKRGRNCLRTKDGTGCAGCLLKCFFFALISFLQGLIIASVCVCVCVCVCVYLSYIYIHTHTHIYIYTHTYVYISLVQRIKITLFSQRHWMHNQYAYLHLILYEFCSMKIVKEILLCSSAFTFLKCQLLLLIAF